ncbi:MAG: hypothetical protein Q7S61_04975 [bacterium]|nr:hypothetical protein [bacterium]
MSQSTEAGDVIGSTTHSTPLPLQRLEQMIKGKNQGKDNEGKKVERPRISGYILGEVVTASTPEREIQSFDINRETKQVLAATVESQYKAFKNIQKKSPGSLSDWQKNFLRDFDNFPDTNPQDPTKKLELSQKIEKYLEDTSRAVTVMKMGEWEVMTRQVVSGAAILPKKYSSDKTTNTYLAEVDRQGDSGLSAKNRLSGLFNRNRGNYEFEIKFVTQKSDKDVDVVLDRKDPGGADLLDTSQKAFIEEIVGNSKTLSPALQASWARRLTMLTAASIDLYNAPDNSSNRVIINFVNMKGFPGTRFSYDSPMIPHFKIEKEAPTGPNVKVQIEEQLKYSFKQMEVKNGEKLQEAREKQKKDRTKEVINQKKAELAKPHVLTQTDQDDIKTLQQDNALLATEQTKTQEGITTAKEIEDLTNEKSYLDGIIPAAVKTIGASRDPSSGKIMSGSLLEKKDQESAAKNEVDKIDEMIKQYQGFAANNVEALKGQNPLQGSVDQNKEWGDKIIAELGNRYVAQDTYNKLVAERQEFEERLEPYKDEVDKLNKADREIAKRKQTLTRLKTQYSGIVSAGAQPTEAELTTHLLDLQSNIKTKEAEIYTKSTPDEGWREYKKEAYERAGEMIDDYGNIQKRAVRAELGDIKAPAAAAGYENYPPAYIRAMQILFGDDIVELNKRNIFAQKAKFFTPELFLKYVGGVSRPPPQPPTFDPYYPSLFGPDGLAMVSEVNQELTTRILEQIEDEARAGTLGDVSNADKTAMKAAKAASSSGAPAYIPTSTEIQTIMEKIYFYENVDDLARRIWDTIPTWGTTWGILPTNVDEAKKLAIEVDNERKKKF